MIAMLALLLAVVNSAYNPPSYACDGATAAFTVPFPYQASSDLSVTSTTVGGSVTTLALTTDYTLSVSSTQSTATLTVLVPATKCPAGNTLKIGRVLTLTQPKSFRGQNTYDPSVHEMAHDREVMQIQQLNAGVLPAGSISDASLVSAYGGAGSCSNQFVTALNRALSPTCTTDTLASALHANQGTTSQVLHGNASGNPAWASVALGSEVSGTLTEASGGTGAGALTCTNQFLTSNGSVYSCSTDTLASAQHANQGTATTVLHGNAAGNPSFAAVALATEVSGTLAEANGGTGAGALTCSAGQHLTSNGSAYSCSADTGGSSTITNQHTESTSASGTCAIAGTTVASLTIASAGTYLVGGSTSTFASVAGDTLLVFLTKNGATQVVVQSVDNGGGLAAAVFPSSTSGIVTFALNDVLALKCGLGANNGSFQSGFSLWAIKLQ